MYTQASTSQFDMHISQKSDTSIFYANIRSSEDDVHWRMTIIFGSRGIADKWWQAISSSGIPLLTENICRITPQLYTHTPSKFNMYNFFVEARVQSVASQFRGCMFFQLENDRGGRGIGIIPGTYTITSLQPPPPAPRSPQQPVGLPRSTKSQPTIPSFEPAIEASHMLAAIIMPDTPDAPMIYSKYIIEAEYSPSPGSPSTKLVLLVNADIAVPRFKSKGASNNKETSISALKVEYRLPSDVTGFARFWGSIGGEYIHFTTNKNVIISGPIEGGPDENQAFVGTGTWSMA